MDSSHILGEKSPTFIGVIMAVFGSTLIGLSYTASKNAHNKAMKILRRELGIDAAATGIDIPAATPASLKDTFYDPSEIEAAIPVEDDDIEYMDETVPLVKYSMKHTMSHPEWWLSILLLIAGEVFNFMAYGFAPTSVIAPLGTLSIISGAVSGYFYLGERMKSRNIAGMLLSIAGAAIIVVFARSEEPKLSPEAIVEAICQLRFIVYSGSMTIVAAIMLILDNSLLPGNSDVTIGDKVMGVRVSLTAIFSGFTVLSTKSISSLLSLTLYKMFAYWITYILLFVLVSNALLTLYFTNKALSSFDSTRVLPAEFAAFTFTAVLGSAMLYDDFGHASILDVSMFLVGCMVTFWGVYFITTGNDKVGKPVNKAPLNATVPSLEDMQNAPPSRRPLSHAFSGRYYSASVPARRTVHGSGSNRISQYGMMGIVDVLNVLGSSTRASLSFQQVVLPGRKEPELIVVSQPPPAQFRDLHSQLHPSWSDGFEIYPSKTEDDEVTYVVRPLSARASSSNIHRLTGSESSARLPYDASHETTSYDELAPPKSETRAKKILSAFRKKKRNQTS